MKKSKNQSGVVHPLTLLLFLLVAAAIGFAGWRVMQNQNKEPDNSADLPQPVAKVAVPDKIQNVQDLEKAKSALNQTNIDNDVNPDSLNVDVNSLL